jgi:hypothetical protein
MERQGDCWATVEGPSVWQLEYFESCESPGVLATGWLNAGPGGLDVDSEGNLVSIDGYARQGRGAIYVFSGCKPACAKMGGPFNLRHAAVYGHLNHDGTLLAIAANNEVDVYA